jgi:ABC-type multidrug transport system ATPase subunit
MEQLMIETQRLTKWFGHGENAVKAVNGIDLKVKSGIHGFLGPNGAGKSTTIKMLIGAISVTSGTGNIRGQPINSVGANKLIGYLPEHPKFYNMSLLKYLEYMGRLGGLRAISAHERALELIDWLDLSEAMDRNVNKFSAGMRQKVGLAQALIHEPELLILDEPTANLDPLGRASVIEKVKTLAEENNISVFVSSHILSEIEKMAEEVTIINKGQILLAANVEAIKKRFAGNHYILKITDIYKVYPTLKNSDFIRELWIDDKGEIQIISEMDAKLKETLPRILHEAGVSLESFRGLDVTLENIFQRVIKGGKGDIPDET